MDSPKQFYRRPLPDTCISFSSKDGIDIFREALQSGHMSCYFKLAEQFRTQDEPAFCGLSTLVMVLNALNVDPGRVWKGVWRWYHESMLDCCIPLENIKKTGLSFRQLICLAKCNGLDVTSTHLTDLDADDGITKFREVLKAVTQADDSFLILNYFRPVLGQTGVGHHSPVGGYHPARDMVLILDTARFKYPPHWVPVSLVWEAMWTVSDTGDRRGYIVVSRNEMHSKLVMFKLTPEFSSYLSAANEENAPSFVRKWIKQISQVSETNVASEKDVGKVPVTMATDIEMKCCLRKEQKLDEKSVADAVRCKDLECAKYLLTLVSELPDRDFMLTTVVDLKCVYDESEKHADIVSTLLDEIEATDVYKNIFNLLQSDLPLSEAAKHLVNLNELIKRCTAKQSVCVDECSLVHRVNHAHFITMFLFSWPYRPDKSGWQPCLQWCDLNGNTLSNEVAILRQQISLLLPEQVDACMLSDSIDVS